MPISEKELRAECKSLCDEDRWEEFSVKTQQLVELYPNDFTNWYYRSHGLYNDFKSLVWDGNPDAEELEQQIRSGYVGVQSAFEKLVELAETAYDKSSLIDWMRDLERDFDTLTDLYKELRGEEEMLEQQFNDRTAMMRRYSAAKQAAKQAGFLSKRKLEKDAAEIKAQLDAMPNPSEDDIANAVNNMLSFAVKRACVSDSFNYLIKAVDAM